MTKLIALIALFITVSNVHSSQPLDLKNRINQFIEDYDTLLSKPNPPASEIIAFFSPSVIITMYDDKLGKKSRCQKVCLSNFKKLKQTLIKNEIDDSKLIEERYIKNITFFKDEFSAVVTTKIKDTKLTNNNDVLETWNLTETLFIKNLNNKLAIVKVKIVYEPTQ